MLQYIRPREGFDLFEARERLEPLQVYVPVPIVQFFGFLYMRRGVVQVYEKSTIFHRHILISTLSCFFLKPQLLVAFVQVL